MKTFVISDTHFGHRTLSEKLGARPIGFEEKIMKSWHRMVQPEDTVIHLGDVVVGKEQTWNKFIPLLPGKKILLQGNHDTRTLAWYMDHGFDFACVQFQWEIYGLKILFSHEPTYEGSFDLNVHGHLHSGRHRDVKTDARHFLVALEDTGYCPLSLDFIVESWTKKRESR